MNDEIPDTGWQLSEKQRKELEKEFLKEIKDIRQSLQHLSDEELQAHARLDNVGFEADVASSILRDRQLDLRRSARFIAWATVITAIATVAAALAAWATIFWGK